MFLRERHNHLTDAQEWATNLSAKMALKAIDSRAEIFRFFMFSRQTLLTVFRRTKTI